MPALLCKIILMSCFLGAFGYNRVLPTQSARELEITIKGVEKKTQNLFSIKYSILNPGPRTVFLPTEGPHREVWSLRVQRLNGSHHWISLPEHLEILPVDSEPVKLGPGDTWQGEIHLENPYYVSRWIAFPREAYVIKLEGELRLRVNYLVGEEEWHEFNSYLKTGNKTPRDARDMLDKANVAVSGTFQLPTRKATMSEHPSPKR